MDDFLVQLQSSSSLDNHTQFSEYSGGVEDFFSKLKPSCQVRSKRHSKEPEKCRVPRLVKILLFNKSDGKKIEIEPFL